jgi:signal transduction histidine kinase
MGMEFPGRDGMQGLPPGPPFQPEIPGAANMPESMIALFHLSNILRQGQTIEEKAPPLLESLKSLTGASVAALALLEGDELTFVSGAGLNIEDLDGVHVSYMLDPLWNVIRAGQIQFENTNQKGSSPRQPGFFGLMAGDLPSYAIIPLVASGSTIGIIFVGFPEPIFFSPHIIGVFSAVSNMAGNAFYQILTTRALEKIVSDRSLELNTLYQITAVLNQSEDLPATFKQALKKILETTGSTMGSIFLLNEDENEMKLVAGINIPPNLDALLRDLSIEDSLEGRVIRSGKEVICADVTRENLPHQPEAGTLPISFHGFPMRIQGRTIGVLSIFGVPGRLLSLDEISLLTSIADHLALSVENYRLRKNSEFTAVLEERARLAREFHDSVTQSLYSATLLSAAARELLKVGKLSELDANLERLSVVTQLSLKEMRLLVYELRSPALDEGGVLEAIRRRISAVELRAGVDASMEIHNYQPMEVREEEELYRITLEGLNNSLKYSNASHVHISFDLADNNIILNIEDDGVGFDPVEAAEKGGFGIRTMRERTEKLGGHFEIESHDGIGTRLNVRIPFRGLDTMTSYHPRKFE